jgi:hypothetical protein
MFYLNIKVSNILKEREEEIIELYSCIQQKIHRALPGRFA